MRLIRPLDEIELATIPVLIYGGPGVGKTSLAQTAEIPFTLDFDDGIHRCANRREAMQFDNWPEVIKVGEEGYHEHGEEIIGPRFDPFKTLVIDTGGRALDRMVPFVLRQSGKNGYAGNLTPQGWGVLGSTFTNWMKVVRSWKKPVVMVCHQEESRNASDQPYYLPDLPGKMSYKEIHKSFDLIGRVYYEGRKRYLDFSPRDNAVGKNAAGFDLIEVPELPKHPNFLADILAEAKKKIGKTAVASAAAAKVVEKWEQWLATGPTLEVFNAKMADLSELTNGTKRQVWVLVSKHAERQLWVFSKAKAKFVSKEEAAS